MSRPSFRRDGLVVFLGCVLIALVLAAVWPASCHGQDKAQERISIVSPAKHFSSFPFTQKDGAIYVYITVNGSAPVLALLDSGSSQVVLDESVFHPKDCKPVELLGLSGNNSACEAAASIKAYGLELSSRALIHKLPSGLKALVPLRCLAPDGAVTIDFHNEMISVARPSLNLNE